MHKEIYEADAAAARAQDSLCLHALLARENQAADGCGGGHRRLLKLMQIMPEI